jgi:putative Ig domain-containing protein
MVTRFAIAALALAGLTACPEDLGFFFAVNADMFRQIAEEGNGVIIGVGIDGAQSSDLVEGAIPAGMILQTDGTIVGVPESAGSFKFTVETIDADGQAIVRTNWVEIEK